MKESGLGFQRLASFSALPDLQVFWGGGGGPSNSHLCIMGPRYTLAGPGRVDFGLPHCQMRMGVEGDEVEVGGVRMATIYLFRVLSIFVPLL